MEPIPREIESAEYIKKHKIREFFDSMISELVYNRPGNVHSKRYHQLLLIFTTNITVTVLSAYMVFFIRQSQRIYDPIPGEAVLLQGSEYCMSEFV